jgi:hypothetical protein
VTDQTGWQKIEAHSAQFSFPLSKQSKWKIDISHSGVFEAKFYVYQRRRKSAKSSHSLPIWESSFSETTKSVAVDFVDRVQCTS